MRTGESRAQRGPAPPSSGDTATHQGETRPGARGRGRALRGPRRADGSPAKGARARGPPGGPAGARARARRGAPPGAAPRPRNEHPHQGAATVRHGRPAAAHAARRSTPARTRHAGRGARQRWGPAGRRGAGSPGCNTSENTAARRGRQRDARWEDGGGSPMAPDRDDPHEAAAARGGARRDGERRGGRATTGASASCARTSSGALDRERGRGGDSRGGAFSALNEGVDIVP